MMSLQFEEVYILSDRKQLRKFEYESYLNQICAVKGMEYLSILGRDKEGKNWAKF